MFVLATQKIILRHDVFVGDDSNLSEVFKRTYKEIIVQRMTEFLIFVMISHDVVRV